MVSYVNRGGVPCIKSGSVVVGSASATITFYDTKLPANFSGLVAVNIAQDFTAPSTAVPVLFNNKAVLYRGANATTANIQATGIYLVFYDKLSNTINLI